MEYFDVYLSGMRPCGFCAHNWTDHVRAGCHDGACVCPEYLSPESGAALRLALLQKEVEDDAT